MNELPTPLYWQFDALFLRKLLQFSQIWRVPSLNCCFQISPTGVQWDLDLDSLIATSEHSSVLCWTIPGCFLKCVWGHCPAARPMTLGGDPALTLHWTLRSKMPWEISWFQVAMYTYVYMYILDLIAVSTFFFLSYVLFIIKNQIYVLFSCHFCFV